MLVHLPVRQFFPLPRFHGSGVVSVHLQTVVALAPSSGRLLDIAAVVVLARFARPPLVALLASVSPGHRKPPDSPAPIGARAKFACPACESNFPAGPVQVRRAYRRAPRSSL